MDPKLQKKILRAISNREGKAPSQTIKEEITSKWRVGKPNPPRDGEIMHQLDLLVIEGYIFKEENSGLTTYILGSKGYLRLSSWYKRLGFFILYDKHNLYSILALAVSLLALIFSLKKGV